MKNGLEPFSVQILPALISNEFESLFIIPVNVVRIHSPISETQTANYGGSNEGVKLPPHRL